MQEKLRALPDVIADLVPDGSSIVLGACLEPNIPFAATHEIIRRSIKGLDVIAPISDISTDMLIGAGCVAKITGAWVGNVSAGLGHNYRRAMENEDGPTLTVRDHSNFSLGMALMAGAYGMPYVPIRSILGSDIVTSNPEFRRAENPFAANAEPVILVPPLTPDVAVLPVQRADKYGNSHHWGSQGLAHEAGFAAETVILLADEIVAPEVIASDPSRVLVPGYRAAAVCHVPAGVHPSPMTGRWRRDNAFFAEYHQRTRTEEGFRAWLEEWVLGVDNHAAYREKLGRRLEDLRITGSAPSAAANYAAE